MNRLAALIILLSFSLAHAQQVQVVTVNDVISFAEKDSDLIKASEKSIQSLEAEIKSRDLVLTSTLTSDLSMYNDHRETISATNTNRNTSGLLDLSLTKPFSTGTKFTL